MAMLPDMTKMQNVVSAMQGLMSSSGTAFEQICRRSWGTWHACPASGAEPGLGISAARELLARRSLGRVGGRTGRVTPLSGGGHRPAATMTH